MLLVLVERGGTDGSGSPRAGQVQILAASIAPLPPPATTRLWISSINRMISPLAFCTCLMTPFNRSSKSL
ncbi:MAG: hypothetical protein R2788_26285 [Saprospiraceae bacterium]